MSCWSGYKCLYLEEAIAVILTMYKCVQLICFQKTQTKQVVIVITVKCVYIMWTIASWRVSLDKSAIYLDKCAYSNWRKATKVQTQIEYIGKKRICYWYSSLVITTAMSVETKKVVVKNSCDIWQRLRWWWGVRAINCWEQFWRTLYKK